MGAVGSQLERRVSPLPNEGKRLWAWMPAFYLRLTMTEQMPPAAECRIDGEVRRRLSGARCVAEQCKALGLKVGDTTEGTEGDRDWWNTTRLTLLWIGEKEAVWRKTCRTKSEPDWSEPCESVNWTLACREWKKLPPNDGDERRR